MTRKLWEEVFTEDTKKFLDYYDSCVADHNQIFVEKEKDELVSMLQLNPYKVHIDGRDADSYYIVAVATREAYRHQGRMRRLLAEAMHQMYRERIPFTWLMPASEAIYQPFDFVTVYRQSMISIGTDISENHTENWVCRPCQKEQIPELVLWSEQFLKETSDISTVRSEEYYRRIWKEQESMNGQILLFYEKEQLKGYCFTGCEDSTEVWEIAVRDEYQEKGNRKAVDALLRWFAKSAQFPIRICGFLPGSEIEGISVKEVSFRPMTMIRIVNLEAFAEYLQTSEEVIFELNIKDPILQANNGTFRFILGPENSRCVPIESTDAPEMTISELAEAVCGKKRTDKIPQTQLHLLERIYLNEVV